MEKLKGIFNSIPKYIMGPLAVIAGIFYFWYNDPPKTICDTQFAAFKQDTQKYMYGSSKNGIVVPPLYFKELQTCRDSNSIGGCYDWTEGLKKMIRASRVLPVECRARLKEVEPLVSYYVASLRMYSQLSWNDTEIVRQRLFHWLDAEDLIVFCRLKAEYSRLMGADMYKAMEISLLNELVSLKQVSRDEAWRRTVLSHDCGEI